MRKLILNNLKIFKFIILLTFVIFVFSCAFSRGIQVYAASQTADLTDFSGSGTSDSDPYLIKSAHDMQRLSELISEGNTFEENYFSVDTRSTGYNLSLSSFTPIGSSTNPFMGNFDGNGVNFNILSSNSTADFQGLFGYIKNGTISNLSISGTISGNNYVGGVVGYLYSGTVQNVSNNAIIIGATYVGGIVGYQNSGTVQVAFNKAQIKATGTQAGGIVGHIQTGTIINTYNRGEILANNIAGGIAGYAYAYYNSRQNTIQYSYNSGLISANGTSVNGIIGCDTSATYNYNTRTALYYDTSVLSKYDQLYTYKPLVTGHKYGRYSDQLVYSSASELGFDSDIWTFSEQSGNYAYYPELTYFANTSNSTVSSNSKNSVTLDVSYGFGTSNYPFLIKNSRDMDELSRMVNKGNSYVNYYFKVDDRISEINLGDFTPIGTKTNPFEGTFDGNGANFVLAIDKESTEMQGLFGHIKTGTIENFSVSGYVKGYHYTAGIIGWMESGTVRNVYNTAKITSTGNYVAGISGYITKGTLTLAYNMGEINGNAYVGGIVGYAYASYNSRQNEISQCYNAGKVAGISGVAGVIGTDASVNYNRNIRSALYYDVIVTANYAQPTGYIKPSSLESATYALNSGELFTNMSSRLNSNFYFETKSDDYAYYPQLVEFSSNSVSETVARSKESVKVDISDGIGTKDFPFLIYNEDDIEDLKTKIDGGNTFEGFYFKVADGTTKFELGDFVTIGSSSHPFYGSFDGNDAEFVLAIDSTENNQGLFGYFGKGTISNLSVTGNVTGENYVGGIVGYNLSGTIQNVYNLADISGTNYVGGIVGYNNNGTIQRVYNNGNITASNDRAGGIVGHIQNGTIINTYNRGEIIANNIAGGIAGYAYAYYNSRQNTIQYSYNSGLISTRGTSVNGIIGCDTSAAYNYNTRTSLYYDTSVLAKYDQPLLYKPAVTGNTYGKTSEWMLDSTLGTYGYDGSIWYFKDNIDGESYYPQLRVFCFNSNSSIATDSLESVTIDVSGGLGTQDYPFLISSKDDMDELSRKVAAGNSYINYYFQVSDGISEIDLGDFTPIGTKTNPFEGTFDGNGANFVLAIDKESTEMQGLFGHIKTGTIENFSVSGYVKGYHYTAGIIGWMESGTVRNVYNTAKITSTGNYVAGISGYITKGTLTLAYNMGEINGKTYVGGIVGYAYASYNSRQNEISQCYNAGKVAGISGVAGVIGTDASVNYNRNIRSALYYDVIVTANYAQPTGYIKPSSLESATYALNSGELFTNMSSRLNSNFYFEEKTAKYAYYPQLVEFSENNVEEIVKRSEEVVRVDISDGMGTKDFPFIIYNEDDIEDLKTKIDGGNTFEGFYFKVADGTTKFELGDFVTIGSSSHPFYGSFDGNDAEFVLAIDSTENNQGLFGYFGKGTISNLSVTGNVTGENYVGGIVGYNLSGTIQNVYNLADISGTNYVGGIVGYNNNGTIQRVYNNGNITASNDRAGGIVGHIQNGTIINTYNRGEIIANNIAGGIAGYAYAYYNSRQNTIQYSYNSGLISTRGTSVNGIIGCDTSAAYNYNTRTSLYYDTSVLAKYDQPLLYKPAVTGNTYGKTSEWMLDSTLGTYGYDGSIWYFKDNIDGESYYPQLRVFCFNSNSSIATDSLESVTIDVSGGLGTQYYPFLISSKDDMDELSRKVAAGNSYINYYFQVSDGISEIDLGDFTPIGTKTNPFEGTFDGNGANFVLAIDKESTEMQGLFGHIKTGTIENFSVSGYVKGYHYTAGIIGWMESGTVRNVYNTAKITSTGNYVAGISGYITKGTLTLAYNMGEINGKTYVGGIVGYAYASYNSRQNEISQCYNAGKVAGISGVSGVIGTDASVNYNRNIRSALYYDVIVTANYAQPTGYIKPSSLESATYALNSGELFTNMSSRLNSNFYFETKSDDYAYYPQLVEFSSNSVSETVARSKESVKVDISDGIGTKDFPFLIYDEDDIDDLKTKIDGGNTFEGFYFKVADGTTKFELGDFVTIGSSSHPFYGSFDGNDAEFVLAIDSTENNQGLFGYFGKGTISNLSVTGNVTGENYVGGIVGYNLSGTIQNVYNLADISGTNYVGGIVGYNNNGTIQRVYNNGNITASNDRAGGIVGHIQNGTIINTYNRGEILANNIAGGIAGYAYAYYNSRQNTIQYSYNSGLISANGTYVNGVIGCDTSAAYNYNTRTSLYYNVSIFENYDQPLKHKPSSTTSTQGLNKTDMFESKMLSLGFATDIWTFKDIDGNYAYFPQLKVFAENQYQTVKDKSIVSVITNPFLGDGTADSPYIIRNTSDMLILAKSIGEDYDADGIYYIVEATVTEFDLSDTEYIPIGSKDYPFKGHFDGNYANFIVNIDASSSDYQGLFGNVYSSASVKNLSVSGSINGNNYVGGIAGYNAGEISDAYSMANISGVNYVGGIAGFSSGTIDLIYNTGAIYATGNYAGGIVGFNSGQITNGYNGSRVKGKSNVGGIAGYSSVSLSDTLLYNQTIIYYDDDVEGLIKPVRAVSNLTDYQAGLEKEYMIGLEITDNFPSNIWVLKETGGLYDYYPQLINFANNSLSKISTNSVSSVSIIRFKYGSGTQSNPYLIVDKYDMKALSDITQTNDLSGIYFKVADGVKTLDLTIEGLEFDIIGASNYHQFKGGFNGNGVTIIIDTSKVSTNYVGLFGYLGENSEVKNLTISGSVTGKERVGALAGEAYKSTISNIYNNALVSGSRYIGGIVGVISYSTVTESYNMADISGSYRDVGGLIGYSTQSTVSYGFNYGVITAPYVLGGIVGNSESNTTISYVYNRNRIVSTGTGTYVGGITGYLNAGSLSYSYSAGAVIGKNLSYIGGVIGRVNGATIETDCYYDLSLLEAELLSSNFIIPTSAIGNKLDQDNVCGINKSDMVGDNAKTSMTLGLDEWVYISNDGINTYYPQLECFSDNYNDYVKEDSLQSVKSFVFVGDGNEVSPYIIVNKYDMLNLSELVATGIDFSGIYFKVKEDVETIDLTYGINFMSIGSNSCKFEGIFDGKNTRFVLNINDGLDYQGLFGYLGENAIVMNLSVSGEVTGNSFVGSIAGYNKGTIENVYSIAKVSGTNYVGGIVGTNGGSILNVYHIASVFGSEYVGGLVGENTNSLEQSYTSSSVFGVSKVGAIVGVSSGSESDVYYNSSKIELSENSLLNKPYKAISNKSDTDNVTGVLAKDLYKENTSLSSDIWTFEETIGFYAYYPQITSFATSSYAIIQTNSKDSVTVSKFNEGTGTEDDPYVIRDAYDMESVSEMITSKYTLKDIYFIVIAENGYIDLTILEDTYVPIGNSTTQFLGNFDGMNTVFDIDLNNSSYYQGLFGFVGTNGVIKNIGIRGQISGNNFVGGIAGRNYGTIENCYNMADISAVTYAGGISGWNDGTITNVFNNGDITVSNRYAGGISGGNSKNKVISFAYNTGNISAYGSSGYSEVGGILGYCYGNLDNVYSAGQVIGAKNYIGGIIGRIVGSPVITNAQYVIENITYTDTSYIKPTKAIGNSSVDSVVGVYMNQLSSDQLFDINLTLDQYVLKQNIEFIGYYPQINVFAENDNALFKADSLESVTHALLYGSGTTDSPYFVNSSYDLRAIGIVTEANFSTENMYFKVSDDAVIDFEFIKTYYVPIGTKKNPFKGNFDGNNILMNVAIDNQIEDYQGIFGYVSYLAKIYSFNLEGYVKGKDYVGLLAGYNLASVSNCFIDGSVTGNDYVGMVSGYGNGDYTEVFAKGKIVSGSFAGGLIGYSNNSTINTSYFAGTIDSSGGFVGGIIGYAEENVNIEDVFFNGTINAIYGNDVGGISGLFKGYINNSYVNANIIGGNKTGGIVGENDGEIEHVFYSGEMKATAKAGGVLGVNNGTISRAYYNATDIRLMRNLEGYVTPTSAIDGTDDTDNVKGLELETMTGMYPIGTEDGQMDLDGSLYHLKEGTDFTMYFPEAYTFKNYDSDIVQADSLKSITYKKIDGMGTEADPYLIYDGFDMNIVAQYVSNDIVFTNKYFKVADGVTSIDLTLDDLEYVPIGTNESTFDGYFDGNNANFIIQLNNPTGEYQGIFHTLGENSHISNFTISGSVIGMSYVGSLAGRNLGTISNILNYASITSLDGNDIGGIVGYSDGSISNVFNYGKVIGNGSYTGGIVGQNSGTVSNGYNKAIITGVTIVGGVVGKNSGTVTYSYNDSNITGETLVGGVVGEAAGNVTYSYNSGDILAYDSVAGGVASVLRDATICGVYNSGTVIANGSQAAGIVANVDGGTIYDAYSFGTVYATDDMGIVIAMLISGSVSRTYYDKDLIDSEDSETLNKPSQAVGNDEDASGIYGLYHGQMIGLSAIGRTSNQMNLCYSGNYVMTSSTDSESYYPQIKYFANSTDETVKADSKGSVTTVTFMVGEGTEDNPYIIRNESDWIALSDSTNNGNDYTSKYFEISNEISELNFVDSEENYQFASVGTQENPFNGTINGNGVNIYVNYSVSKDYQGIFGYLDIDAHVKGISVSGTISARNYTGAIAGYNAGTIEEVYNQATIKGYNYVGGIVGYSTGSVINTYNHGQISGNENVGGIVGYLNGELVNSYNSAVIFGKDIIGTIVGFYENGDFENSYYDLTVLNGYRSNGSLLKPEGAVGTSYNGNNVKGLDNQFMVGTAAIGTGTYNMAFSDYSGIWSTVLNLGEESNYPQLVIFANSDQEEVQLLSQESTESQLYTVTFDEANETINTNVRYVVDNQYFSLYVPEYFGFDFIGWYYTDGESVTQVTNSSGDSVIKYTFGEDVELYATWEISHYLVEFVDGNNNIVYSELVEHGLTTSEPEGIIPSKASDSLYVYKFLSWDFDFDTIITSATEIKANYEYIDRYYEVTYYDGDNNPFAIEKGEYDMTISPISEVPAKTYTDNTAYKFTGWDFDFGEVISAPVDIYPLFEEVDRYYTVNFYNENLLIEIQTVEYLQEATVPLEAPQKTESAQYTYVFSGWDTDFSSVTSDLDVNATYTANLRQYMVIFKDGDGLIIETQEVSYGGTAQEPVKQATKTYVDDTAYEFVGWDKDYTNITGDLIVTAKFVEVDRYYEVKFYDATSNLISTQIVEYLSSAETPDTEITKESTVQYTYTFTSWDQDFTSITSNLEIYPIFSESLRQYEVYFVDGNNETFDMQMVEYGKNASVPSGTPRKDGVDEIGYKFTSWTSNYTNITDITYVNAQFSEVQRYYIVTFYYSDLILKSEKVEYGYGATAPSVTLNTHPSASSGYEYYFIGWDKDFSFVESNLSVNVKYGSRLKTFTVTIVNGDETTTQTVDWGKNATLPTPYKTGNEQITYKFVNWDQSNVGIKADTVITAIFDADYIYYEVRFYDGDLNLIKLDKVIPGEDATAPSTASKLETEDKIYVFINWDKDFTEVDGDLSVYAQFKEVDRYYTVIFYDANDGIISVQTVEYGMSATEPNHPVKSSEGLYEYTFDSWDHSFNIVTSNLDIKPIYTNSERKFNVEFYDGDGQLLSSQKVVYGKAALAPDTATKTPSTLIYYIFDGWDTSYTNVTEDLTITALFTEVDRYYNIRFIDKDNNVLDEQVVEYGQAAIDPRPNLTVDIIDDTTVYAIIGWDSDITFITSNKDVNAVYSTVDRYYTVSFYAEGVLIDAQTIEYGSAATTPTAPEKASTADYFYTFKYWDKDTTFITSNLDINAIYEKTKLNYNVTFVDGDGNTIKVDVVKYQEGAEAPSTATKLPTASEMYVFTGWDKEFSSVTSDLVVTAQFSSYIRTFTVIFKDDIGNILKEETVEYGSSATAPTPPEKEATEYFTYTPQWDQNFNTITEDMVINLYYNAVERLFYATFYDYDGTIIQKVSGAYGTIISAPEASEKPMTNEYVYTFSSWNPEFSEVLVEDVEYNPIYEKSLRLYKVTFLDGNENEAEVQYVTYGATPTKPSIIPEKDTTNQYYYIFRMWETTSIKVYQDVTIRALFYKYLQQYKVTFIDENDNILSSQMVEYGTGATEPEYEKIPVKPQTNIYTYAFAGWDKQFSFITEDITVQTVYIGTLRKYSYIFYDEDGITVLKEYVGIYGDSIITPTDPCKDPEEQYVYTFIGWDKPVADTLIENVIYVAQYKTAVRQFVVTFLNGDGSVFQTMNIYYDETATTPSEIPTKASTAIHQYVFVSWDGDLENVKEDRTITPLFSEELRQYQVKFVTYDGSSKTVLVEYGSSGYGKVSTPLRPGYSFVSWSKDLTTITSDVITYAEFRANSYDVIFYGADSDSGSMDQLVVPYDSTVDLPTNTYTRKGYDFIGWRLSETDTTPAYLDGTSLLLDSEGLNLYATWQPIVYNITYDLDGGIAVNPTEYTIEDRIVLQDAIKEDYEFTGWYISSVEEVDKTESTNTTSLLSLCSFSMFTTTSTTTTTTSDEELEKVEIIEKGFVGNITLIARYEYAGYIKLTEESTLGMYYADITTLITVIEREPINDENPVYLLGVYLGQTIEDLNSNFINNDLVYLDSEGNELSNTDTVKTGMMVVIRDSDDSTKYKDRLIVVLKGDINGDGYVTLLDFNTISGYINKKLSIEGEKLISCMLNDDEYVTLLDLNILSNHINKKQTIDYGEDNS